MAEYDLTTVLSLRRPVIGQPNWGTHLNATIDTLDGLVIPDTIFTAKGQLLVATASGVVAVLNIGANDETILADSAQALGVKWGSVPAITPTGGGKETVSTNSASGAAATLNLANGNVFDLTLTANCTLTFSGATSGKACSSTLVLRQDGTGGRTVTWPAAVTWLPDGTAPVISSGANGVTTVCFLTLNGGTVWYGFFAPPTHEKALQMGFSGTIPAATSADFCDFHLIVPQNMTLKRLKAVCKGAPTSNTTFQVRRSTDSAATFANAFGTVTVNASAKVGTSDPADLNVNEGDVLQASVTIGGGSGTNPIIQVIGVAR